MFQNLEFFHLKKYCICTALYMISTAGPGNNPITKHIKISAIKHMNRHLKSGFQGPQIISHWFRSSLPPTELWKCLVSSQIFEL